MRKRFPLALALLLVLTLSACAAISQQQRETKRSTALDDFIYVLRWQRYEEASMYFTREQRPDFLDLIDDLKGLNITEVRLKRAVPTPDRRKAEVRLEIDYYLLPSATLKTMQIDQTWVYFETPESDGNGFLITTAFPKPSAWTGGGKGVVPP
jgi:hypothetical protein